VNRHRRIGLVHAALALLALAVLLKAAHVQIVQGSAWADLARRQHFTARDVPAPRGRILDASGRILASTRDLVRLEIAPREVRDVRRLTRLLAAARVEGALVSRAADRRNKWVTLPGHFIAEDVAGLTALRGVYTTPVSDRSYAMTRGLRALVGRAAEGRGIDGIELAFDSLLRGENGRTNLVRDVRGKSFASPTSPGDAPTQGHSVTLTINHDLQEIAERTLADAVARMDAEGGDIVILDPRGGEVLAIAGERHGRPAPSVTALTEPFEPGSTLKPLIAAGLLARGLARTTDMVPMLDGAYELHGRRINDEPHEGPKASSLSLADVIRYSSNVGIVQFAERLTPRQQYETLRDFGLGTQTGFPYPAEASGTLRPPNEWSKQSLASLSMGYEIAVTPLQLALAYAAIGNGGELLQPALIQEIRAPDGGMRFRHERRVVRRVMPEHVARTVGRLLFGVVESGTAMDADLATFSLAGKTGTPRRTVDGRYAPMQYNPNFVGLFPAVDPQLVIVVKLVNPKGNYYGGHTAAPTTKAILEAALASPNAALDRGKLAAALRETAGTAQAGRPRTSAATARVVALAARPDSNAKSVVLDLASPVGRPASRAGAPRAVPSVRGLTLREAVRSLHGAGFRVQLSRGTSSTIITEPASGSVVAPGTIVRLRY
jgi:cell division protein FtsI (penicillin-binding protein 3)